MRASPTPRVPRGSLWLDVAIKVATVGLLAWAVASPDLPQFQGKAFAGRTRAEWTTVFEGTDACVAPVLGLTEAPSHPHNAARGVFIEVGGVTQPAPAPRFDRTPAAVRRAPVAPGTDTREALTDWGVGDVDGLIEAGVAKQAGGA